MNIIDYIRGNRKGKNAQQIERKSMSDIFLYEAIEGYDSVEGNHRTRLDGIYKRIRGKQKKEVKLISGIFIRSLVAASLIGVVCLFFYMYESNNGSLLAQKKSMDIIEIYVPKQFYTENIAVIAQNNTRQVKLHKPINMHYGKNMQEIKSTLPVDSSNNKEPITIYFSE